MYEQRPRRPPGRSPLIAVLQVITAVVVLGAVGAVIWTKVVRTTKETPTHAIGRITGRALTCTDAGTMSLRAGTSVVLLCTDPTGYRACWIHIGDSVSDVTNEVRSARLAGAAGPRC